MNTKICIICPEHGEFWQKPNSHLNGCGCPKCGQKIINSKNTLTTEEWVEKVKSIHGNKYDYSKVRYLKSKIKVSIVCPKHGEFWQTPDSHLRGNGCPKCRRSHIETIISTFLEENGVNFIEQKTFEWLIDKKNMFLDFYLPEYNVAIECQGEQHFKKYRWEENEDGLLKRQERDKLKRDLCEKHNIKVFYVNYNDNINEKMFELFRY